MKRLVTTKIVIHHSVMPQNMEQKPAMGVILSAHKSAGLAPDGYMAYHRVTGGSWTAPGRPENLVGYHAGNWLVNQTSVAVCIMGNFNIDQMNDYQKQSLKSTLQEWMSRYGVKRENILIHRQVGKTACPGAHIDRPMIYALLDQKDTITDEDIKKLFREVWGKEPAYGDWYYFRVRLDAKSITNLDDMRVKMGIYKKYKDADWQKEKRKWLK